MLGAACSSPKGGRLPQETVIKLDAKTATGHVGLHMLLNQQEAKGGTVKARGDWSITFREVIDSI